MSKGDYYRWNKAKTVEDVHQLDIRQLDKRSLYQPGTITIILWDHGKHYLQYTNETDRIVLTSHSQTIRLDRTSCNYGGERQWFLCPKCSKRVAVLYMVNRRYYCRHCHGLPYASQRATEYGRLLRKTRKLRKRLGASGNLIEPIYIKPKGMHWKTFSRLMKEEQAANIKCTLVMGARYGIL